MKEPQPAAQTQEVRELRAPRQARWTEEWLRRRRQDMVQEIAAMSEATQAQLVADLLADMVARQMHPSIRKRLQTHGWQHPMGLTEMVRFYALGTVGEQWDKPTAQQLLAIAAEMGDAG